MSPLLRCVPAALALLSSIAFGVAAERATPLTRAIDVRSLSTEEAQKGLEVRLTGTIIFNGTPGSVFLQDETAGTSFALTRGDGLQVGDIVEVTGRTRLGYYLPGIGNARYRVVGHAALPAAVPASYDDLIYGRYHYQRVGIEGIVRSQGEMDDGQGLVRIAMGNRIVEVRVQSGPPPASWRLVDGFVHVEGLAAGTINSRRQLVQPFLRVADWTAFKVQEAGPPDEAVPRISAAELLTFRVQGTGNRRVRLEGTVTAMASPRLAYVRHGDVAFGVHFSSPTQVAVGDRIDVRGFPHLDRFSASLVDAELATRAAGEPPPPHERSIEHLLNGLHDCDLVAVTATVTDSFRVGGDLMLTLQDRHHAAQARVPGAGLDLAPGTIVRVQGICLVETSTDSGYNALPDSVSLRVRSAADVTVVQLPPWWSARRLLAMLAALAAVVLIALLWIFLLRRQVTRQTVALRRRIESEAALEERHRIAREFHDTLEQDLAGLGLRLDAAAKRATDEKGRGLIAGSRSLVSRIQVETRNLISDLRNSSEQAGDLPAALQEVAARAAEPARSVQVKVISRPPVLSAAVVHHLRMIAGECVTNALKHGEATQVTITIETRTEALVLTVADNGRGFDVERKTHGQTGHFGCVGIRERCRKLGAEATWASRPGHGAVVAITLRPERPAPALAVEKLTA